MFDSHDRLYAGNSMTIRNLIFDIPWIFIKSRSILHGGFQTEKGLIRSHVGPKEHVLDFGCGTGQYAELFDEKRYVGIDIAGSYLRYARKQYPTKTFLGFDKNFSVPRESLFFDWVLCFAVVHHVPHEGVERFCGEILRVLRRAGQILILDHLPVSQQGNAWSKFLLSIDRGHFPRSPESVIDMFGNAVRTKEKTLIKTGPYSDYLLVLEKRH